MITIQRRAQQLQVNRAIGYLLIALPFVLGYVLGVLVRLVKLGVAAFLVGYERGTDGRETQ